MDEYLPDSLPIQNLTNMQFKKEKKKSKVFII